MPDKWIAEGELAARCGKRRVDCPYDKATQDEAWNYWVYGNENEQGAISRGDGVIGP